MKNLQLFFLFLFFSFCGLNAQSLRFSHLGIDQGLSQSSVYSIFQDSRGFMWFGSGDGLNRYDGNQVKIYRHLQTTSPLNNFFTDKMIEDAEGNLWIGSRNGLTKYNFRLDKIEKVLLGNSILETQKWIDILGFDADKNIWFWDRYENFYKYNPLKGSYKKIKIIGGEQIFRQACFDGHGMIWYTSSVGLFGFNIKTETFDVYMQDYFIKNQIVHVNSMSEDKDGLLWLGGFDHLICFNTATRTQEKIPEAIQAFNSELTSLLIFNQKIFLGSQKRGLLCYDKQTKSINKYSHNNLNQESIATDIITAIYVDHSENLWVASDGFGLNIADLKPIKFPCYRSDVNSWYNLSSNFVKGFFEDSSGRLWIGNYSGDINILDRNKQTQITVKMDNSVAAFTRDRFGNVLVATDHGVVLLDEISFRKTKIPYNGYASEKVLIPAANSFCHTDNGALLLVTTRGLFIAEYKNGVPHGFKLVESTKGLALGSVFQTSDGRIWAGNFQGGCLLVLKFEGNELVLKLNLFKGLNVKSFYEDIKNHLLWMGSENGLIRYDLINCNYKLMTEQDGLANNHIYGLLCDKEGRLWLSTNKGLSCYNPRHGIFRNYDVNDGLQSNEFNTNAYFKSNSGELFFGGINGFNAFFPASVLDNPYRPLVTLCRLMVNDEETIEYGNPACLKNITLEYSENTLSFDFSALEFTGHDKNRYEYKLIGTDKEWVKSGNKHFARYSNLRPGNYKFLVRASNNDGLWSDEKLLCTFTVQSPWWRTWWASVTAALFAFLIVYWFVKSFIDKKVKVQQRQLEKQKALEEERNRISKDMHDDLGSGLSKIAIMSELLKSSVKDKDDVESIGKISRTANELVDSMSQIIWAMNPENDNIENILGYLRKFSLDFFEDSAIRCQLKFPSVSNNIKLQQSVRRNIFLVIKETFHNILKHSKATEVSVEVRIVDGRLTVVIADNGCGFDMDQQKYNGNGLNNMKKRMQTVNGSYQIKTIAGKGTETELSIDLEI